MLIGKQMISTPPSATTETANESSSPPTALEQELVDALSSRLNPATGAPLSKQSSIEMFGTAELARDRPNVEAAKKS
jgi:hypothetical protein